MIWEKTYGGPEPELWPMIIKSYNNGYLLFGNLASNASNAREILAIQINSKGDIIWTKNITENFIIDPISITKTNDNGFLISAESKSVLEDIYIMKTDSLLNFENILAIDDDEKYSYNFRVNTYPNPTNNQCNIEYKITQKSKIDINIYDILGRNVLTYTTIQNNPGNYKYIWNINSNMSTNLSSGVYIIKVDTPFWSVNRKILYLK